MSSRIAMLIKEKFVENVKILKKDGENFYWFTVKNSFPYDILFCVTYIHGTYMYEGSTYGNIEIFNSLEDDITQLSNNDEDGHCLLGDFNAHTKDESDYVEKGLRHSALSKLPRLRK